MFGDIGAPELLIILAIVVLLFGAGRVGRLGKDLGTAVKDFRHAVKDEEPEAPPPAQQTPPLYIAPPAAAPVSAPPPAPTVVEPSPAQRGQKPPEIF